jgi:protein TonB
MFEDSTFASTGKIRMRTRAGFFAALILDSAIVVALVLVPLLYPRVLPRAFGAFLMNAPVVPVEQPSPKTRTERRVMPAVLDMNPFQAPIQIPQRIYDGPEPKPVTSVADLVGIGSMTGDENPFAPNRVAVTQAPGQHPIRVPSTMVEGLILQKTVPVYPPIARATHTQGTVVLQATIARDGTIENLRVAGGSPMLQQAAIAAVSTWRYRPYMLNGVPIEVETTINVVFKLNE